jgi:hypothetical protein
MAGYDVDFSNLLVNTCTIKFHTTSLDGSKNPTSVYLTQATGVRTRRVPLSGQLRTDFDVTADPSGLLPEADTLFYMEPDQAIKRGDRIELDGEAYTVFTVEKPQDDIGVHHIEAYCKQEMP